jgi:hypothetical protein
VAVTGRLLSNGVSRGWSAEVIGAGLALRRVALTIVGHDAPHAVSLPVADGSALVAGHSRGLVGESSLSVRAPVDGAGITVVGQIAVTRPGDSPAKGITFGLLAVPGDLLCKRFPGAILTLVALAELALGLVSRAVGGQDARNAVAASVTHPVVGLPVGARLLLPGVLQVTPT